MLWFNINARTVFLGHGGSKYTGFKVRVGLWFFGEKGAFLLREEGGSLNSGAFCKRLELMAELEYQHGECLGSNTGNASLEKGEANISFSLSSCYYHL